ncbi:FAD binding domain-containing protein [Anderseniella sp. Alg231-50]|uniref:FAD binding domain-containing protein n=1 Tax=Anderseniella sp. Alg231-50 TaxID=1922226 RepID=UPI000D5587CD
MLTCDQYHMPTSLADALAMWQDAADGTRLVAGATDILPWAREGRAGDVHLPAMIDLSRVPELDGYTVKDGRIRLGANVVYQQFLSDEKLRKLLPCMPYCAVWFADDQIREQATLAGNIVNASPAADGTPPILALNGEIEIARLDDGDVASRSVAIGDFIKGPGATDLKPGEIVTAVTCDTLEGYGGSFQKVGQRRSLVISSVCAVACIKLDEATGTVADIRLALGGISPVPLRLSSVEQALTGKRLTREMIVEASRSPADLVASRTRREYRRVVVRGFVEAAIEDALADCGAALPNAETRETANV